MTAGPGSIRGRRGGREGGRDGTEGVEGVFDGGGEGRAGGLGAGAGEDFNGGIEARAGVGFRGGGGEAGAFGVLGEAEEAVFGGGELALEGAQFVVGRWCGVGPRAMGAKGGLPLRVKGLEGGGHGSAWVGVDLRGNYGKNGEKRQRCVLVRNVGF